MHTPNDEIKAKTFLSFSDVDGEGSCFFLMQNQKYRISNFPFVLFTSWNYNKFHDIL